MESDSEVSLALQGRLADLLKAMGSRPLSIKQVYSILGVEGEQEQQQLLHQLKSSAAVRYNTEQQLVYGLRRGGREAEDDDDDFAALMSLSDADNRRHRSASRQRLRSGYHSDIVGGGVAGASHSGLLRRRGGAARNKPGLRGLDDASTVAGQVGRVGYLCVADELHLGKLETYYRAQGYYTKFDFDVLRVRFAQPQRVNMERSLPTASSPDTRGNAGTPHHHGKYEGYGTTAEAVPVSTHSNKGLQALSISGGNNASDGGGAAAAPDTGDIEEGTRMLSISASSNASPLGTQQTLSASVAANRDSFDMFVFSYGAVVWWGFDQRYFKIVENDFLMPNSAISHCATNRYSTQLVNENYPVWCTYSLERKDILEVDDDFKARLLFDHFLIPYTRGDVATSSVCMLCASHALAQSAKIDYLELKVQELTVSCSPLPRELRERGSVTITERRLLQLRGEVLSYRLMLKSGSDLLDEPNFFWENAYLKPFFQATKECFDISERVEALDNKLDAANEILSMLAEDFSQRHGARLEWIVIWLVFVEVVIGVLELLVDIRPWLR